MYETLYVCSSLVFFLYSKKIDGWTAISRLGLKTETPMLFITNENLYRGVKVILFLNCVLFSFLSEQIIFGLVLLLAIWFFSTLVGQKNAFRIYREIMVELGYDDKAKTSDADLRKQLRKQY